MDTPYTAFVARAQATPAWPFLLAPPSAELSYAPDGFRLTYGAAAMAVGRLRGFYAGAGYGHGTRVALLLENRPIFFLHWLALNALGVSIQPINPDLRADDLAFQLALGEPDLIVAVLEAHALVRSAKSRIPMIEPGEAPSPCTRTVARNHGQAGDECALLFTSGTSGKPKGCVLSNDYFMRLARWYVSQGGIAQMGEEEIVLTPLPLFHMNALACSTLGMILRGGAIVPLDRFHAQRWWRTVADIGATVVHYLGVMPAILLKLPPNEAEGAHKVRFGFGAGVDPAHQEAFERRFGFPLVEAWAMTETGAGAVTSTAVGPRHIGARCIGRPFDGMEYRIVDDSGTDVAKGRPGELLVRTRDNPRQGFFTEYLKDSDATADAWHGGWFHTGDVVRADGDGCLFFVDRKKNIVRRSGENIAVSEVEGALAGLEVFSSIAVTPVPDETRGEEVCALVTLPDGRRLNAKARQALAEHIVRACALRLAYFKAPGYIAFVDAIPITSTQKLQRGEVRTLAAKMMAEGKAIDLRALKGSLRQA